MANDENLKNQPFNFYKVVYFINYQANSVPRHSRIPALREGVKVRDTRNEVAVKHHSDDCSPMKLMSNESCLCVQTS